MVPVRLRQIVQLVLAESMLPAATACSSGFQRWVRALLHQGDARLPALAERVAELRDELEPGRAATDHDDMMTRALVARCK